MAAEKIVDTEGGFPRSIGNPATRALNNAGFRELKHLTKATEAELMALHGFGPKALAILQAALKEHGLALAESGVEKRPRTTDK